MGVGIFSSAKRGLAVSAEIEFHPSETLWQNTQQTELIPAKEFCKQSATNCLLLFFFLKGSEIRRLNFCLVCIPNDCNFLSLLQLENRDRLQFH